MQQQRQSRLPLAPRQPQPCWRMPRPDDARLSIATMRYVYRVFLKGLLAVLPLAVTGYLLVWLATTFESLFKPLLSQLLP
ncbi:MAG: hypothetical protein PVF08_09945, partial [Gammaproteobacteria bacterium]